MSENVADQFRGLPMVDLIGGPLAAAADAQKNLANTTAEFIREIGFEPASREKVEAWNASRADIGRMPWPAGRIRNAHFAMERPKQGDPNGRERLDIDIPLLAIVKVPALSITRVNISFDMEVKSSLREEQSKDAKAEMEGTAKVGWGPVSASIKMSGSVSSHESNTRSSDTSAKYKVEVYAEDRGTPEGLARVLDMMHSFMAPSITGGNTPAAVRRTPTDAEVTEFAKKHIYLIPDQSYEFPGATPRYRERKATAAEVEQLKNKGVTITVNDVIQVPSAADLSA